MLFQILLLSFVQGVCEFLPISSSLHLLMISKFFNFDPFFSTKIFIVSIHFGSLIAIIVYFFSDIKNIIKDFFKLCFNFHNEIFHKKNLFLSIFLSTLPLIIFTLFLKDIIEKGFNNIILTCIIFIIFGYFLKFFDKDNNQKDFTDLNYLDAIKIGFFEVFAIIPGVSRSGITITSALALKYKKEASIKISFLLAIPVIFGAIVLYVKDSNNIFLDKEKVKFLISGIFFTSIFSFCMIKIFINFLKKNSFNIFFYYRLCLGILIIFLKLFKI